MNNLDIIGAGNMGSAIARGALQAGFRVRLWSRSTLDPALIALGAIVASEDTILGQDSIVLLAVKPYHLDSVASYDFSHSSIVISVLAGLSVATLSAALNTPHLSIVRAMPNVAAALQQSITTWFCGSDDLEAEVRIVVVLNTFGTQLRVQKEALVDAATAVAGSGTAFALLYAEASVDAAVRLGFTRDQARALTLQTMGGAVALAQHEAHTHLAAIRARVVSPGGTTADGLRAAEQHGLRAAVAAMLDATMARAHEIANE